MLGQLGVEWPGCAGEGEEGLEGDPLDREYSVAEGRKELHST